MKRPRGGCSPEALWRLFAGRSNGCRCATPPETGSGCCARPSNRHGRNRKALWRGGGGEGGGGGRVGGSHGAEPPRRGRAQAEPFIRTRAVWRRVSAADSK